MVTPTNFLKCLKICLPECVLAIKLSNMPLGTLAANSLTSSLGTLIQKSDSTCKCVCHAAYHIHYTGQVSLCYIKIAFFLCPVFIQ